MKIIKAGKKDKTTVLQLLDEFRTECLRIIAPLDKTTFTTAIEFGESIFDNVVDIENSAILLAMYGNEYIGILTIHKLPRIRRADYCAEIEDMYVRAKYQGQDNSKELLNTAINWALENNIRTIRL